VRSAVIGVISLRDGYKVLIIWLGVLIFLSGAYGIGWLCPSVHKIQLQMKHILILTFALLASFQLQAQIDDTLPPWFRLPDRLLILEGIIGPLSASQTTIITTFMTRAAQSFRPGNVRQVRQRLKRAIVGVLNDDQRRLLRESGEGEGPNGLVAFLRGFPPRPWD